MGIKYNNLKAYRKETGMTQEQAAEALGVSRQALAKWERGDTLPDLENVIKLADIYGVTVDYLVRNITGISDEKHDKKHMFGFSNIDEDGRIMLPPECRKIFGLKSGDAILVLGDEERGIALIKLGKAD